MTLTFTNSTGLSTFHVDQLHPKSDLQFTTFPNPNIFPQQCFANIDPSYPSYSAMELEKRSVTWDSNLEITDSLAATILMSLALQEVRFPVDAQADTMETIATSSSPIQDTAKKKESKKTKKTKKQIDRLIETASVKEFKRKALKEKHSDKTYELISPDILKEKKISIKLKKTTRKAAEKARGPFICLKCKSSGIEKKYAYSYGLRRHEKSTH